jgi:hypothetical protein
MCRLFVIPWQRACIFQRENPGGNQPACKLAKEEPDMLNISATACRDDFSIQVLKQMAWLQQELAKAEQRGLDVAELTSIRGAILKSLAELKTLYKALD